MKRTGGAITERLANPHYQVIFILLVSTGVYFNALFNGLIFDDIAQILINQWIRDVRHIPEIMTSNVWGWDGSKTDQYRPLMYIIYMAGYHLFGLSPWGYHLINILLHGAVSVMVFFLLSRLLQRSGAAGSPPYSSVPFISALLFAVHPIHTEAVTWVASLPDVSYTFFALLSLHLYIRSTADDILPFRHKGAYLLSVISFFVACFCKEPALILPLFIFSYDFLIRKKPATPGVYLKRYFPYLAAAGIYFVVRAYALKGFAPLKLHTDLSTFQIIINVFPLFIQYLEKLLLPVNLNAFYVFHPAKSFFDARVLISFVLTCVFAVGAFLLLKKKREAFWGILIIVGPLLPVFYIPAFGVTVFAERYLYLPSFGFIVLVAVLAEWIKTKKEGYFPMLAVVLFVIIGLYSVATITRNRVWENGYTFWSDTVQKAPDSAIPHDHFGYALYLAGRVDEAMEHYLIALELDPKLADAHNNIGNAYLAKGMLDKALEHYQAALRLRPDYVHTYNNIGLIYNAMGLIDKAMEQYRIAIRLNPDFADAYNNLGIAYARLEMIEMAIKQFDAATKLAPDNVRYRDNLSKAYEIANMKSVGSKK